MKRDEASVLISPVEPFFATIFHNGYRYFSGEKEITRDQKSLAKYGRLAKYDSFLYTFNIIYSKRES